MLLGSLASASTAPAGGDAGGGLQVTVAGDRGERLSGARVELFAAGHGLVSSATTDGDGLAVLPAAAAGTVFWLRAWADGHAVVEQGWVPAADDRFLHVALPARYGQISGQVVDARGAPVAGATVTAWEAGYGAAGRATTGDNGNFTLRALRPGEYQVQVEAGSHEPVSQTVAVAAGQTARVQIAVAAVQGTVAGLVADARAGRPLPGARVDLVRQDLGVMATAVTAIDGRFTLTAPPAAAALYTLRVSANDHAVTDSEPFALAPGERLEWSGDRRLSLAPLYGSVWGFLLRTDEEALAGARVELQLQGGGTVATTTTAADGFFSFDRVLPGTYRVRAFPGRWWAASDSEWVTVAAGEQRALRIEPVSYEQRGYGEGTIAGFVSDGGTLPITGAEVVLLRGRDAVATTTTDDWGRYRFARVHGNAGTEHGLPVTVSGYLVRVVADGYLSTDQPVGGPEGELTVRDDELTEANFHLRPSRVAFSGRVLDDAQEPVAGATVHLFREGSLEPVATATTGTGGRYRFDDVPAVGAVRYVLSAAAEGYRASVPSEPLAADGAAGGHFDRNLVIHPTAARLLGQVIDARGDGVAGAAVTVARPADGRTWTAQTADDGWFGVAGLPAGPADRYLVRAQAAGMPPAAAPQTVTLAGQRSVTVTVAVAPPAALAGTVYDAAGRPVAGARVSLFREGIAAPAGTATTAADGRYRFDGLQPGERYAVLAAAAGLVPSALAPGDRTLTPLVQAVAGAAARRDIVLHAAP